MLFFCMVGASNQWSGLHMEESKLSCTFFEGDEFVRAVVPVYGHMGSRWSKILPYSQNFTSDGPQVMENRDEFIPLFAEANHQSRFDER